MLPTGTNLKQKNLPQATITIIAANIVVFMWEPLLIDFFGNRVRVLAYGIGNANLVSLFTSVFLHADLHHLVFNMLFFWVFGPPVEDRVGKKLFFVYYLGAGVAANVFELLVDIVHRPDSNVVGIGASGAVSGIMALYLYRCFYSKMKVNVTPLLMPFNITFPAAPLLIAWFFQDIYYGIASFTKPTNIANWAHVGGFLFGLAVGRIKKYGHEGAVEHYSEKVLAKLSAGNGWKDTNSEQGLLKLAKLAPNDPDIHLQLGQFYTAHDRMDEARTWYQSGILKLFISKPLYGADAVQEYIDATGKALGIQHHLRAAEILSKNGDLEKALKVIQPVLNIAEPKSIAEKIAILNIKLTAALQREDVNDRIADFNRQYPDSKFRAETGAVIRKRPEDLFPTIQPVTVSPKQDIGNPEDMSNRTTKIMLVFNQLIKLIVDPLFLFTWFLTFSVLSVVCALLSRSQNMVQVISFTVAYLFAAVYRIDWSDLYKDLTIDEAAARAEVDMTNTYNKAMLAERGENYPKAAQLYEEVLAHSPHEIQARFNLARIYFERMNDRDSGFRHAQHLIKVAPVGHPYNEYARDELKKSSSRGEVVSKVGV